MTRTDEERHQTLRRLIAERRWHLRTVGDLLGISYNSAKRRAMGHVILSEEQLQKLEALAEAEKELAEAFKKK
jgi:hypothetical protein